MKRLRFQCSENSKERDYQGTQWWPGQSRSKQRAEQQWEGGGLEKDRQGKGNKPRPAMESFQPEEDRQQGDSGVLPGALLREPVMSSGRFTLKNRQRHTSTQRC